MAKISTWLRDMLARSPGAIRTVARREFMQAVREFYVDSTCIRASILIDVVGAQDVYTVTMPAGFVLGRILRLSYSGSYLRPLVAEPSNLATLEDGSPYGWLVSSRTVTAAGPGLFWQIKLIPTPINPVTNGLLAYVSLLPDPTLSTLPDVSERDHYDALLDGALSRLYMHPGKPYSNPQLADMHRRKFIVAKGKHLGLAKKGEITEAAAWAFPRFGK